MNLYNCTSTPHFALINGSYSESKEILEKMEKKRKRKQEGNYFSSFCDCLAISGKFNFITGSCHHNGFVLMKSN